MKHKRTHSGVIKICFWMALTTTLFFSGMCAASEGDAIWESDGIPVVDTYGNQKEVKLVSDGDGGAIYTWQDRRDSDWKIFAQRLDENGSPQWLSNGVEIAWGTNPEIVSDDSGGAIITWQDSEDILVQRISSEGELQWTEGGVFIGTGSHSTAIAEDGSGGAFVVFSETPKIVHIGNNGMLTAPGVEGISLGGGVHVSGGPAIISVDEGNVMAAWATNDGHVVVQKITTDMTLPWGAAPVELSSNNTWNPSPEIDSDGSGSAVVTWVRSPGGIEGGNRLLVQKIDADGSPLWTTGGVILVDSDIVGGNSYAWYMYDFFPDISATSEGGAIAVWNDWRSESGYGGNDDIYAQRVNENGIVQWDAGGIKLHNDLDDTSQRHPRISSDGADGGVVVFQDIVFYAYSIYAVGLDESGKKWDGYVYYDNPGNDQTLPEIIFDDTGSSPTGAIVAWMDETNGSSNTDIYAQKIENEYHDVSEDGGLECANCLPDVELAENPTFELADDRTFERVDDELIEIKTIEKDLIVIQIDR